jgi:hypothetical protein
MAMFMDQAATIITERLSHPDATQEIPRPGGREIIAQGHSVPATPGG